MIALAQALSCSRSPSDQQRELSVGQARLCPQNPERCRRPGVSGGRHGEALQHDMAVQLSLLHISTRLEDLLRSRRSVESSTTTCTMPCTRGGWRWPIQDNGSTDLLDRDDGHHTSRYSARNQIRTSKGCEICIENASIGATRCTQSRSRQERLRSCDRALCDRTSVRQARVF